MLLGKDYTGSHYLKLGKKLHAGCSRCDMLQMTIDAHGFDTIENVYIEEVGSEAFEEIGVMAMPTLLHVVDNEVIKAQSGIVIKEQVEAFLA